MTERRKEATLDKLRSLSWQRKLHERNSSPKCVYSGENDQYWKPEAKPNSDSESRPNEYNNELHINQTPSFKTKNGLTRSKQDEEDRFFNNHIKEFDAADETSTDQGYEHQSKNKNGHGSIYRRDEKENVNIQRNEYRNNAGQHFNSQNQKYSKREDKNANFRGHRNVDNKSPNYDRSEAENIVKEDQRYSRQPQSRNYNQNNRGYNRNQERSNQQNNYNNGNDAKSRSNYQNTPRIQHFQQNNDNAEESSCSNENSFPHVSSNYSKQGFGLTQEKSTPGIHYQRYFPSKTSNKNYSFNGVNNQSAKSKGENFFPQTEQFAQLNLSSEKENCTTRLENISNHYQNFNNADNYSTHSFSDQFTAGISEPIPTNVHPHDTFRTSIQLNQSSNIPVTTATFIDNYISSDQSRVNDNFVDCSYSNQITASSSSQSLIKDNFCDCSYSRQIDAIRPPSQSLVNGNFTSGSYSNQITDGNRSSPSMFNDNLIDGSYLNQISAVRSPSRSLVNGNLVNFSYSNQPTAGNSSSQLGMNDNLNDYSYSNQIAPIRSPSRSFVNSNFANCSHQNPIVATSALPKNEVSWFGNQFTSNDVISTTFSSLSPHVKDFIPRQNRIQHSNQMEFSSAENLQLDGNLENTYAFSSSTPNNSQHENATWLSQSNVSNCNKTINFRNGVGMLPTFCQNDSSEGLNGIFSQQQMAAPDTPKDGQSFNFYRRMVNLSGKDNKPIVNEYPPSYDNVQHIYTHPNNSIDDQFNYDINGSPGTDNYPENLSFNNQQISNILQIASLNVDQESSSVPLSGCQRIKDMFQIADVNVNMNENIVRQTNASILSQTVVNNASNLSLCEVKRNSRVNIMQDYYVKPTADVANNSKSNESEELNSMLEKLAQQLFNVNKYVTNAEMNTATITTTDSVCDSNNSKQFNVASFKRHKNEMERYRQYENMLNNNGNARQRDFDKLKPNVTLGKAPSVGILKKSTNSVLDTTMQFQKSPKDQNADDSYSSSKENFPSSKRVSFLLEDRQ